MSNRIAAILNVYKRPESLQEQLEAVQSQTVKPSEIFIWQNGNEFDIPQNVYRHATVIRSSSNLGVWARFAFALNADAEYICVFDDDTIPGSMWFENCLSTMEKTPGLLGARGLRFKSPSSYRWHEEFGWNSPNEQTEIVDIVGHSWFFKREWLASFWQELGNSQKHPRAGEDIHFSYAIQKHLGLSTYVPPHPAGQEKLWGSTPQRAIELGGSDVAISGTLKSRKAFQENFNRYIEQGFRLVVGESSQLSVNEKSKDLASAAGFDHLYMFLGRMYRKFQKLFKS